MTDRNGVEKYNSPAPNNFF